MTTLEPRPPYTPSELNTLYPPTLRLQQVQIILRHGERSPVTPRFTNAGLPSYWPYCSAAKSMQSTLMATPDNRIWTPMEWRRRLETFGANDNPSIATGPSSEIDGICNHGELTDQGRATTLSLGKRLRHLYVDQLHFLPAIIADADFIYMRATPIPRALESVQQAFAGLYPKTSRTAEFPPPTIVTRASADETLFPNDGMCRRFRQLAQAYGKRAAERWNGSADLEYVNGKIGRWMPEESPHVKVDSHPRLSGIMDTVNSTLAHPAPTRLPREFYDRRVREVLEKVNVEEWFAGYAESREYRQLGIGALVGDIAERMVGSVEHDRRVEGDGLAAVADARADGTVQREAKGVEGRGGETGIKLGLSGAHDTTLAAVLTALGVFDGEAWPPYTSHLAFELFKESRPVPPGHAVAVPPQTAAQAVGLPAKVPIFGLLGRLLGGSQEKPIARRQVDELTADERARMDGYFVRIRYNDRVLRVPGCATRGNHVEGDESFCTLEAFKRIVDDFTPRDWKAGCVSNMGKSAFPEKIERAGF